MKIVNPFNREYKKEKALKKQARILANSKLPVISNHLQGNAINCKTLGVKNDKTHEIIVSLTTFGHRINDVYITIESLMQQSLKADKIILNISKKDFNLSSIPSILKKQCERGLHINFINEDLGPYTKFFYTLKEFPNSLIITVDDDQIYPMDLIDQLYNAHLIEPNVIHCHRAHKIKFNKKNELLPYRKWDWNTQENQASKLIFPTGIGGVIYFPGCFDENILNKQEFLELCPGADDIWLKAMSLKNDVLCKKIPDPRPFASRFLTIENSQINSLISNNKIPKVGNDKKIHDVFFRYDLLNKLSS